MSFSESEFMGEIKKETGMGVPNLVTVCVDESKDGSISGRIYHYYEEEPQSFSNLLQLLRKMEDLYDDLRFPEAAVQMRRFRTTEKRKAKEAAAPDETRGLVLEWPPKKQLKTMKELLDHKGEKATFYVWVRYRQNATWQGSMQWAEGNQEENFRSALELIIMMDNILNTKKL